VKKPAAIHRAKADLRAEARGAKAVAPRDARLGRVPIRKVVVRKMTDQERERFERST
jgi:hypothetical protein